MKIRRTIIVMLLCLSLIGLTACNPLGDGGKITEQARHFPMQTLEGVYRGLLDIDEAIKSGRIEDEVALDGMVAGFTTR